MNRVWIWIERGDGGIERHVGPFEKYDRHEDGRVKSDERGRPVYDAKYVDSVMKLVGSYEGSSAYDVAEDLSKRAKDLAKDETGVLRRLASAIVDEVQERVRERQRRAERGALRAEWLADAELATMKIRVRAE